MRSQQQQLAAVEKQRQALELRLHGTSYAAIATKCGYSKASGAHAAVKSALRKTLSEPAEELRVLEAERLDALLASVWDKASKGDPKAVDNALRIMERRAKLLGLDAPTTTDITSGGGPLAIVMDR